MADSQYIFDYLNDLWDMLPDNDKIIFGETWKAYEQCYAAVWTRLFEYQQNSQIQYLRVYNSERWLQHTFNSSTSVAQTATYVSPIDLSAGIDLSSRYLIDVSLNGGAQIEIDLRGVVPTATTLTQIISRINTALGAKITSAIKNGALLQFLSNISGITSSIEFFPASNPSLDASALILGFDPAADLPKKFPQFPYNYALSDNRIVGISSLQNFIHDELATIVLNQGVDYVVNFGTGIIEFAVAPPATMWAKNTYFNYETPYNNFGYLMNYYDTNTPDYVKAVKGLWFAYWTGPTPENIKRSLYLLFGLPVASKAGVVASVSGTQITMLYNDTTKETFAIPANLSPLVVPGQVVNQFFPLVNGIQVFDKINSPGFLRLLVGRPGVQPFLTQYATKGTNPNTDESKALVMLEENTYLPQIDVNAFVSPNINLANVKTFLTNLQPKSRTYLFQILVGNFLDQIPIYDEGYRNATNGSYPNGIPSLGLDIVFDATYNVDWNNNTMGDADELADAEDNPYTYLTLDSDYLMQGDSVEILVYQGITLIDDFTVEG